MLVTGLLSTPVPHMHVWPALHAALEAQAAPRLYYPPTRDGFQPLKRILESDWIPELCRRLAIARDDLPVIWDADFLYGPKSASGDDTYVLCEINVSAVFPFPDSALEPLADAVVAKLKGRTTNHRT